MTDKPIDEAEARRILENLARNGPPTAQVAYVMAQLGHADPKVTLKGDTGERLDALVRAADWAATGSDTSVARPVGAGGGRTADEKTAY